MNQRGQVFTLDMLFALILVTLIIGCSGQAFELASERAGSYSTRYSLERVTNDAADVLIKTLGEPGNWWENAETLEVLGFAEENGGNPVQNTVDIKRFGQFMSLTYSDNWVDPGNAGAVDAIKKFFGGYENFEVRILDENENELWHAFPGWATGVAGEKSGAENSLEVAVVRRLVAVRYGTTLPPREVIFSENFPNADGAWDGDRNGDTAQDESGWYTIQGDGDSNDVQVSNEDQGSPTPSGGNHLTFEDCDHGFHIPEDYDLAYVGVDLSGYSGVMIEYYWQSDDVDWGEGGRVAYSTDSTNGVDGTWIQIAEYINPTDDVWTKESYYLPYSACVTNFKLRFSAKMNRRGEHMYFDDVLITGIPLLEQLPATLEVKLWR
jgi:hypothetical protein